MRNNSVGSRSGGLDLRMRSMYKGDITFYLDFYCATCKQWVELCRISIVYHQRLFTCKCNLMQDWITVMHLLTLVWNVQKFITSLIINENSHTPSYGSHRLAPDWLHPKWHDEWYSREQQLSTNQCARKIGALRASNMNNHDDFMSCDWFNLAHEVCGRPLRKGFSCTVDGVWSSRTQKSSALKSEVTMRDRWKIRKLSRFLPIL
jgi:hypothetical protein